MESKIEQLKVFLQDIAIKENYALDRIDIKPLSSAGANFTADLYLATISDPPKPDLNIFAKTAILSEETRNANGLLTRVYEIEAIFYSELAVNFERIYNKHQVPNEDRLRLPKYYGNVLIRLEEMLVLENLEAKGFRPYDRTKTFNWEYASAAVTQLARLHALGLAYREENPVEFENIVKNLVEDYTKIEQMINLFVQMGLDYARHIFTNDEMHRFQKLFDSIKHQEIVKNTIHDKTMLIHADFRPNNLMHRRRNGKLEVIILDYQTLRWGNPVYDLIYFTMATSDEDFRRLHYQRLMDHYFTQLTLALKQLKIDVEKVYPRKTFEADLIELRPIGLFLGIIMIGGLTLDPEDVPNLEGDMNKSWNIKPNQLAIERIRGLVNNYIKWGVL